MPEVGGFICDPWGNKARIVRATLDIIFTSDWHTADKESKGYVAVGAMELAKVLIEGYTFEPKPEEPKREIPKDGTPVKSINGNPRVFISAGKLEGGCLHVYVAGTFEGDTFSLTTWEVIK